MLRLSATYFDGPSRILVLEGGGERIYVIDHYEPLPGPPAAGECVEAIELGEVALCYIDIGEPCRALALITGGRAEVISLRLHTTVDGDPASGSPRAARELCAEALRSWLMARGSKPAGAEG